MFRSFFLGEDDDDTRSEVSADEESLPSTFALGDLAWARVGQAPYWPCVITLDPISKDKYTKVWDRKGSFRREYHLQFFGVKVERAWVVSSNMLKFEGLQALNELAQTVPKKQRLTAFKPRYKNQKPAWDDAIDSCAKLVKKSNEEILEISAKAWENKDKNNATSKKRRRKPKTKKPRVYIIGWLLEIAVVLRFILIFRVFCGLDGEI